MRDRELTTRVPMIMASKISPRVARIVRAGPGSGDRRSEPRRVGPTEIQAAAQEALLLGHALAEPEIAGIIPEIPDAEVLHGDDAGGVDVFVVDTRVDGLGAGLAAGPRAAAGGGAGDSKWAARTTRAEQSNS